MPIYWLKLITRSLNTYATWFGGLNLLRILVKFANSLNLKLNLKQLFSHDFWLSFAKRPDKPLMKAQPERDSKKMHQNIKCRCGCAEIFIVFTH